MPTKTKKGTPELDNTRVGKRAGFATFFAFKHAGYVAVDIFKVFMELRRGDFEDKILFYCGCYVLFINPVIFVTYVFK